MDCQFVEGLHANDHCQREKRDDDTRNTRIDDSEKIGPPASKFEAPPQQRPREPE